jgi:predicted lipoprotein with Yx(FWY)xxD motif
MRKSWLIIGVSLLTVLAVSLVACGGSSGSKKTSTPTSVATKATAATSGVPATSAPTTAAGPTVKTVTDAALGVILTDSGGYTLYKFANDSAGVSNCATGCTTLWPPLTIAAGSPTGDAGVSGTLATIDRSDGTKQVTYNGLPVYRFANDTAPGDTKGEGFANLWSVVKAQ